MSVEYCENCDEYIDTDFNAEHFEDVDYHCKCCNGLWVHGGCENTVPIKCPHCTMPVMDMIKDTFAQKDFIYALKIVWKRITF